jgi:hypothetical protein
MSETEMEWTAERCRADPTGAAAEIRRLTKAEAGTHMHFTPQALGDLHRIAETDPQGAEEVAKALIAMRDATQAWRDGKYATLDDAMEALTGTRPEVVVGFDDWEDNGDLDGEFVPSRSPVFTVRRDEHGHAAAIDRDGYTVLLLATGAQRNEDEVDGVVSWLNR